MKPIVYLFYAFLLLVLFLPFQAKANPLPFMPEKNGNQEIKPVSSDSLFGGLTKELGELAAPFYSWGVIIITALFVLGTVVMILSMLFKNGQWQKYGQSTMFISFVVMLIMRGLPIVILSVHTANDFDILLRNGVTMLSYAAIFLGLVSIAVSFLFRYGYRLIEHPDFHRWSRNLLSVSILMMIFAVVIPFLFPVI